MYKNVASDDAAPLGLFCTFCFCEE